MSDNVPEVRQQNWLERILPTKREPDTLPKDLMPKQPKIKDMKPGESGYVTPWTMSVDALGYCYLDPEVRVQETPLGTVSLLVGRMGNGDYFAEASNAYKITFGYEYDWDIRDNIDPSYIVVRKVT